MERSHNSAMPWSLVMMVAVLSVVSVVNLYSTGLQSQSTVHLSQSAWIAMGFVVMAIVSKLDGRFLRQGVWLFYGVTVLALALVLVFGTEVNGSRRWLDLGFARFQPSEIAKPAVIMALAAWFQREAREDGYTLKDLIPVAFILGAPMFLILQEPDLGHTMMLLFIGGTMVAFEKFERRAVVVLLIAGLTLAPAAWMFVLRDYQKDRVLTLLDRDGDALGSGWHARQARLAVGSGGLLGKGHGEGTQVAGGFLPENHTDFVFAHLAEEYGFLGSTLVLILYFSLIIGILGCAARARDRFGAGIAVGVASLFFWHVVMNVGMVLNVLPVTGVTLPLMSYGGSSVLTVMLSVGLVLNIDGRRRMVRNYID